MRSLVLTVAVAALLSSIAGFCLHVFSAEWLQHWIAARMEGRAMVSSWDVRVPAAISAIEIGLGASLTYWLLRSRFPALGWARGGLCLAGLILMIKGNLIRQPLMNFLVGNPVEVVAVQDGMVWLTWAVMGWIIAGVFALFDRQNRQDNSLKVQEA